MTKQNVHDNTICWLVHRLEKKGYDTIVEELNYTGWQNGKRVRGEFDVLAIRGNQAHYYEIKSYDTSNAWLRAKRQFERVDVGLRHLDYEWSFIYVTPTSVKRVRI